MAPRFPWLNPQDLIEKKMNRRHALMLAGLASILAACGKRKPSAAALKSDARVLALGDSLTVGYGATPEQAWPTLLAQQTGWQIDNEGVNGDTSAGALQRLESLLAANSYDAVLVGIGGNDMLRGVSQQATKDNVAAIVRKALAHTSYVAVIATPAPEPLRATVGSLSDAVFYEEVATAEKALLIPDVYSNVLSDAALRSDRIHANAQGYAVVAQQLADKLKAAGWR
jgi:acyl-CoA thioesterase-1